MSIYRIFFTLILLIACEGDKDKGENTTENEEIEGQNPTSGNQSNPNNQQSLVQFTPEQASWSTFYSKGFSNENEEQNHTGHDPDGIWWIPAEKWQEAQWDGTIYNPSKLSKKEFSQAICPGGGDTIRGIRELFYEQQPFADNANPSKAEVDEWHRIAINHVRSLIGYTSNTMTNGESQDRTVKKDHCMFARALWGQQRKFTTDWDESYPGNNGSAAGPCQGSSNAHCGASFIPSPEDQAPYLPSGHDSCGTPAGSEGISSAPKSDIPWSIKWSRAFCGFLGSEGFWGGHVGPFFHREKFGFSFWDVDPENPNTNAILRAKWTGKLMPNLYCNPSEQDCDPDNTGPDAL